MAQNTTSKPDNRLDAWVVELLGSHHAREEFSCGVESLDVFLKQQASQNAKKDFSKTFVAMSETASPTVVGYYTIAMSSLEFSNLPKEKHLPRYPIPVAHLGRLAVDVRYRGRRIGEFLLFHALLRVQVLSEEIGVFAVEVKALDAAASQFYIKYGFVPLSDDPQHLYMNLEVDPKIRTGITYAAFDVCAGLF